MSEPTFTAEQLRARAWDMRCAEWYPESETAAMLEFAARLVERTQHGSNYGRPHGVDCQCTACYEADLLLPEEPRP